MFQRFGQLFRKNLQKVLYFAKKHQKSPIWPKCASFSTKPRCLRVLVNFSAKSCKKCLISRKSMKNRRYGQTVKPSPANHHVSAFGSTFQKKSSKTCLISRKSMRNRRFCPTLQLFRANHHVSAFESTFQQKAAKSASFREKVWKIVHLAKMCNFFEQTTTFCRLGQLLSKKLQKVPHFVKNHEKSSISPNCKTFSSKAPRFGV